MVSPLPNQQQGEDTLDENTSSHVLKTPAPIQYLNGISPVAASRLSYYLTKENLGWSLLLLIAADYFGISSQVLGMASTIC